MLKVDMRKVNLDVMRPWIANKVVEFGLEDELVVEYAMGLLEDPAQPVSAGSLSLFNLLNDRTSRRLLILVKCKSISQAFLLQKHPSS